MRTISLSTIRIACGEWRFTSLFIALFLMCFTSPFLRSDSAGVTPVDFLYSYVLLAGLYAVSQKGWFRRIAVAVGIASLVLTWSRFALYGKTVAVVGTSLKCFFFLLLGVSILRVVMRAKKVSANEISGALCVYLLMGVFWTFAFVLLAMVQKDAFQSQGEMLVIPAGHRVTPSFFFNFVYLSFVTLSTLGYGDITPVTPQAQSLCACAAVIGQLFLAVLIAGLVGLRIAQGSGSDALPRE